MADIMFIVEYADNGGVKIELDEDETAALAELLKRNLPTRYEFLGELDPSGSLCVRLRQALAT